MSLAKQARAVERDIFGALIGTLTGALACRLVLLAVDLNVYLLVALLGIGGWSGGFIAHLTANRSDVAIESLRTWALQFRRVCLRIMLWLLGAAAVFGVLSVLTASYDVVGRIAGTAALTAFAAGLLWPFSILMDRDAHRNVGMFGAASVIAIYLLVTPSIWNLGQREEEAALAGLVVGLMMPFGLGVMMLINTRVARVAGLVGMALYVCVLTSFLIALWYPDRWYQNEEWWGTGFAFAGFGAIAIANLIGAATDDHRNWRWAGVLAAMMACGLCLWGVWSFELVDEKVIVVITSVAIAIAHANLTMLVLLRAGQVWLRIATICVVAVTAFSLDVDLLFSLSRGRDISIFARIALASGILSSCGTLALVILACLNRAAGHRMVDGKLTSISLSCPRCGKRQTIPLDDATCSRCELRIQVHVEEREMDQPAGEAEQSQSNL